MEAINTSFTARRPAAGSLPAFSLPPPNAEIPRTTDGLSPSLSVHTGGSQASQHHSSMHGYTFGSGAPVQGSNWSNNGSYQQSNGQQQQGQPQHPSQQPIQQQGLSNGSAYGRPMYNHGNDMAFNPRTSQSPATGTDGLAAPPFGQSPQHYTHDAHAMTGAPQHSGLMATSSQPPMQSALTAHSDYAHTRPGSNPSYYASSGPSQFPAYAPHSPSQSSPTTGSPGSRGLGSVSNGMGAYRYGSYNQLPTMGGPVMSNMHQPGGQMSMIPGMSQHGNYGNLVYGHPQPTPQTERPFKCDQCIQSFSRNHDLKRHKRIHLAVKPFPCNYCSKSFSRKDALKRHRLVKGCENKSGDQPDDAPRREVERERD